MPVFTANNIFIENPLPADSKYLNEAGVPYPNVAAACTRIPIAHRHLGLTVNINNEEYWWRTGTADGDLVVKGGGGSGGGSGDFTVKTSAQMRAITDPSTTLRYFLTDTGKKGTFAVDITDTTTADDGAMTFVTSSGLRVKRELTLDTRISVKWFGAIGNDIADDTVPIQTCVDYCLKNNFKRCFFPAGTYKITNGIVVFRDANVDGFPDFVSIWLEGESTSYGYGNLTATKIHSTHVDNFAFAIQFGKGCKITNLGFLGENYLYSLTASQIYSGVASQWVVGSSRGNAKSPYSAIVIDPFHINTPSADRYPRMTQYYTGLVNTQTTGSTKIMISDVFINNYVVGVIFSPNGVSQNAECCTIEDCWIDYVQIAVCNAQSQTRQNDVRNLICWGGTHTVFSCTAYGQANGVMPNVIGANIAGYVYRLFQFTGGWSNASFINVYAEGLFRLGVWGTGPSGLPVSFINCYFDIPSTVWYTCSKYISGNATFVGCIVRQYNNRRGFITSGGAYVTFQSCMLSSPVVSYRDLSTHTSTKRWTGRTEYVNCSGYLLGHDNDNIKSAIESDFYESSDRLGFNQCSTWGVQRATIRPSLFGTSVNPTFRTQLPFIYEYRLIGENTDFVLGINETGRTVTFNPNNGTATFTAATGNGSKYMINDILSASGLNLTIDGEAGIPSAILGVVIAIAGDVITVGSVPDWNPTSATLNNVQIHIYAHVELLEPVVGELVSGSNQMTNCKFTNRHATMRAGTVIEHPAFPYYTRVTSYNISAGTITFSNNSTVTDTQAELEFSSKFTGSGSALQDPSTISFSSPYVSVDPKSGLVLKGSLITNIDPATNGTIMGWFCTKTGYLSTNKPPVFTTIPAGYKNIADATDSKDRRVLIGSDGTLKTFRTSGTTLERPTGLTIAQTGFLYFDETLGMQLTWTGSSWLIPATVAKTGSYNDLTDKPATSGAETNTIQLAITGGAMGIFNISMESIFERILVNPTADLSALTVGILSNDTEFVPATPVLAGQYSAIDIGAYISSATDIYVKGITSNTAVKLIYKPLHI